MDVTLKELNRSYEQLKALVGQPLPRGKGDVARRFARIKRTADKAIENWEADQKTIAIPYGFRIVGPGQIRAIEEGKEITYEVVDAFNQECDKLMKAEIIHFRGEPFTDAEWKEIEPFLTVSGEMLAQLEWLIPDDYSLVVESEPEKAVGASA